MMLRLTDVDELEDLYRKKVLRPHRRKHHYPNHANECQQCTPCVRDIFEFIKENVNQKAIKVKN